MTLRWLFAKTRDYLHFFVCDESGKRKGRKKNKTTQELKLWIFMDPPHWILIAIGWGMGQEEEEEGGGVKV